MSLELDDYCLLGTIIGAYVNWGMVLFTLLILWLRLMSATKNIGIDWRFHLLPQMERQNWAIIDR